MRSKSVGSKSNLHNIDKIYEHTRNIKLNNNHLKFHKIEKQKCHHNNPKILVHHTDEQDRYHGYRTFFICDKC